MYAVDSRPPSNAPADRHRDTGTRRRRRVSDKWVPWGLATPALVLLALLLAYPVVRMVILSFQDLGLRQLFTGEAPPWVGFQNYSTVLGSSEFWTVVWHTVLFTAVSVSISVVLGLAVALLMRRVARWVRLAMIVAMMFVWALPQLVQAQTFKLLTDSDYGVINYLIDKLPGVTFRNHSWFASPIQGWAVITGCIVWAGIPFLAVTLNAGLTQVPKELLEAATVDGATPWKALRHITLPILKPLLMIVTTLSVIWNFGVFGQIWSLRDGKPEPEFQTLGIYSYTQAFGASKYSLGSAISVITVLMLLAIMTLYVRQMFKIGEVD